MKSQIIHLDPADLAIHPLVKLLPEETPDSEPFATLVESIRDCGIEQPLIVDKEHRILKGRRRWRAARRLQLTEVPVIIRAEDPATVILNSLLQRRHYTKSARAYLAYPLMKQAHEEARHRWLARLKSGGKSHSVTFGQSIDDFADQIGVGVTFFKYAAKVHDLFAKDAGFKAQMEPKILDSDDGVGLGAVIAGHAGQAHTKGKSKNAHQMEFLFAEGLQTLVTRAIKLQDMASVRPALREIVGHVHKTEELDRLLELAGEIESQVKARKKALAE